MTDVVSIGAVAWSREELTAKLAEFSALYEQRPIADNTGGMQSPQLFPAWFALQALRPDVIVESGVFLGQGTWFFERACPDAELYCLEPRLERIRYRSQRARYLSTDFVSQVWNGLPRDRTVLFFDDHQDAYERVLAARALGFRHLLFEDNYPPGRGDCRSLKQVLSGADPGPKPPRSPVARLTGWLGAVREPRPRLPLRECLEVYYEFPPVMKSDLTRWGDSWNTDRYPTAPPLLERVQAGYQQCFADEVTSYTWLCYARLYGAASPGAPRASSEPTESVA